MSNTPPAFTRTAADIVAEVLMTRSAFSGAIVLVEGATDSRFLRRHLLIDQIQLIICYGKQTAIAAMAQMASLPLSGYLAVVDRDFDDHKGIYPGPFVFYTYTHDTETLLLSVRLETVLSELAEKHRVDAFEAAVGSTRSALLQRAEAFSRLRYLNEVNPAFGIGVDGFSPWKYVDQRTWILDEHALNLDFSAACGHSLQRLAVYFASLPDLRNWVSVQGHDTLAILSIGLRHVLGSGKQVSENQLSSALRLAFTEIDFQGTKLYGDLRLWQDSNGIPLLAS
jgi:hypothetical protein